MSLYAQENIVGNRYKRAATIVINNPLGGQPTVIYNEEWVVLHNNVPVFTKSDAVVSGNINIGDTIALRDLVTGELTGETVPILLVYQALYSDYMNRAIARDQAALAQSVTANSTQVVVSSPEATVTEG